MSTDHSAWDRLVQWLSTFPGFKCHVEQVDIPGAGKGLVATTPCEADQPLLIIPPNALLNPLTLLAHPGNTIPAHLFPQPTTSHRQKRRRTRLDQPPQVTASPRALNTTQLLTLHLALSRDPQHRHPSPWNEYLQTIPQDFAFHPLVWAVTGDERIRRVPRAARRAVDTVRKRFDHDREVLGKVLRNEEPFKSERLSISVDDILWAWLIVNTRSVSLPLGFSGPTELFNHSLVPILDLANHSSHPTIPRPRQIPAPIAATRPGLAPSPNPAPSKVANARAGHLIPGRIAYSLVAPSEGFARGKELRFEYHGLCNTDLWAEYGFAESPHPSESSNRAPAELPPHPFEVKMLRRIPPDTVPAASWTTAPHSGINVGHLVASRWTSHAEKEQTLRLIGCWDRCSLHPSPTYEASHGLLMTLRVMHLTEEDICKGKLAAIGRYTVDYVSEDNEAKVKKTLREMCDELISEVEAYLGESGQHGGTGLEMEEVLWWEQEEVARGCLEAYS